jgi:uncharacterized protein (DUF1697 family)
MATFIAFLRAVNVGKRQVRMADLRAELEANGFTDAETFIASGNLRVTTTMRSAAKVEKELERVMEAWLGFDVPTMVRTPKQLVAAYDAGSDLKSPVPGSPRHYLSFLKDAPPASAAKELESWDEPKERAQVVGREVHLWLGSDRPKLTNATMEKILGTLGTARDWKTVTKLAATWGSA